MHGRCRGRALAGLLACLLLAGPSSGEVWHVDADAPGTQSGLSWEDAFTDLQSALDEAQPGDNILVAQGTYLPDITGLDDPREATFHMVNVVWIRGGFAGYGEPDPDARDVAAYPTILSGDIGFDPHADMNGDGTVDFTDFTNFSLVYSLPCP